MKSQSPYFATSRLFANHCHDQARPAFPAIFWKNIDIADIAVQIQHSAGARWFFFNYEDASTCDFPAGAKEETDAALVEGVSSEIVLGLGQKDCGVGLISLFWMHLRKHFAPKLRKDRGGVFAYGATNSKVRRQAIKQRMSRSEPNFAISIRPNLVDVSNRCSGNWSVDMGEILAGIKEIFALDRIYVESPVIKL